MSENFTFGIAIWVLLFIWITGFFVLGNMDYRISYFVGSVLIYLMANIAYTKLKKETERLPVV